MQDECLSDNFFVACLSAKELVQILPTGNDTGPASVRTFLFTYQVLVVLSDFLIISFRSNTKRLPQCLVNIHQALRWVAHPASSTSLLLLPCHQLPCQQLLHAFLLCLDSIFPRSRCTLKCLTSARPNLKLSKWTKCMLPFQLARSTSTREMQARRVKKRVSLKRKLTLLLLLLPMDRVILAKKVSVLFHLFLFTKVRFYQKNHSYSLPRVLAIKTVFVSPFFFIFYFSCF